MPIFSWSPRNPAPNIEQPRLNIDGSLTDDDELAALARYIAESELRWARQTARIIVMEKEGRDTTRSERILRDLEETAAVLRQRQKCLELDARSRRLLAATRERLSRSRPHRPKSAGQAA